MMSSTEGTSSGGGPSTPSTRFIVKEGEVSPYKIVVVMFMKELYSAPQIFSTLPDLPDTGNSPNLEARHSRVLIFLHRLITSHNVPFQEFQEMLEAPEIRGCLNPDAVDNFMSLTLKIMSADAFYLYDLANSILDSGGPHHIMHKKIAKNSPFGRFLRMVLLNIRKMDYSQALSVFKSLLFYIGGRLVKVWRVLGSTHALDTPAEKKTPKKKRSTGRKRSIGRKSPIPSSSKKKPEEDLEIKSLERFQNVTEEALTGSSSDYGFQLYAAYATELRKSPKAYFGQHPIVKKQEEYIKQKEKRAIRSPKEYERLHGVWSTKVNKKITKTPSVLQRRSRRLIPSKRKASTGTVCSRRTGATKKAKKQIGDCYDESNRNFISEGRKEFSKPAETKKAQEHFRSILKAKRNPKPSNPTNQKPHPTPQKPEVPIPYKGSTADPSHLTSWDHLRWWGRRQIERLCKFIEDEFYLNGVTMYSYNQISSFVRLIKNNPSSQTLIPHLEFIECLNCLRFKDVTIAANALRSSFDARLRTTPYQDSSNNARSSPYAPFNFSMLYASIGLEKDSSQYLDEAFRAAHLTGDSACLQYCRHLWSSLRNIPYSETPLESSEVGMHTHYLSALNAMGNFHTSLGEGVTPVNMLKSMTSYGSRGMMHALQIHADMATSIASIFSLYGWKEVAVFPSYEIIMTGLRWPAKSKLAALYIVSQYILSMGYRKLAFNMIQSISPVETRWGQIKVTKGSFLVEQYEFYRLLLRCQRAYYGFRPVKKSMVSNMCSFSPNEAMYWGAYSELVRGALDKAKIKLDMLWNSTKDDSSALGYDLKLRCLFLRVEWLRCCGNSNGSFRTIECALDIAKRIHSDVYIAMAIFQKAFMECSLKLFHAAKETIELEKESVLRAACPFLNSRFDWLHAILYVKFTPKHKASESKVKVLIAQLDKAKKIQKQWKNKVWLRFISDAKKRLIKLLGENTKPRKQRGRKLRRKLKKGRSMV